MYWQNIDTDTGVRPQLLSTTEMSITWEIQARKEALQQRNCNGTISCDTPLPVFCVLALLSFLPVQFALFCAFKYEIRKTDFYVLPIAISIY